jgi:hypothetical protein
VHREERGLGQEQLGQALYTPRANLSRYESLTRRPELPFADQLDEHFGRGRFRPSGTAVAYVEAQRQMIAGAMEAPQ